MPGTAEGPSGGPSPLQRAGGGLLLGAVTLLHTALVLWMVPRLPEQVASHFGSGGRPDGWMSRDAWLLLSLALAGGSALLFGGIGWLLPRLPAALVNIPHREWWLAPERRDASLAFVRAEVLRLGTVVQVFLAAIQRLNYQANRMEEPALDSGELWTLLGILPAYVAWMVVRLIRRFPRPARA